MGLLDSLIGALGQSQAGAAPASGSPLQGELLQAVMALLQRHGGLAGLVEQFQRGGLGDVVASWVATGQNQPVSPDALHDVLGSDTVAQLARQLGIEPGAVLGQLSQVLPQVVDQLTPQGRLPQQGEPGADLGALSGALEQWMARR